MTYAQLGIAVVTCVDKAAAHGPDQIAHACEFWRVQSLSAGCVQHAPGHCFKQALFEMTCRCYDR